MPIFVLFPSYDFTWPLCLKVNSLYALPYLVAQTTMAARRRRQVEPNEPENLAAALALVTQHMATFAQHMNRREPGPHVNAIIPTYSGQPDEDFDDWEASVNRLAATEGWDDDTTKRVAVGRLRGAAARWHDQLGQAIDLYVDWIEQLRDTFRPAMSLTAWCQMVEARRQLPHESAAAYALEKAKLCRLCPAPLTEEQTVPYLIRGLARPEHVSVLMGNLPTTVSDFIAAVRRLEELGGHSPLPLAPPHVASMVTPVPPAVAPTDVERIIKTVTEKVVGEVFSKMEALLSRSLQPVAPIAARPRRPISEITCFRCNQRGHYQSHCPSSSQPSAGNGSAGLSGQNSRP